MKTAILTIFLLITLNASTQSFSKGSIVDVYTTSGKYYRAKVIDVNETQYKVNYDGFTSGDDAWVDKTNVVRGGKNGEKVVVVAADAKVYYGTIESYSMNQYKVRYNGYPDLYSLTRLQFNFAEAISTSTEPAKTAPAPGTNSNRPTTSTGTTSTSTNNASNTFAVGTAVEAIQRGTWYAAVIKEIKDGKYLVKYDGYYEEEWVTLDRLKAKPPLPTLPAEKLRATTGKVYIRSILWIATGYTELSWWFLGDNGVIIYNPVSGVNPINLALEQQNNNINVGTYKIEGGMLKAKWLKGNTSDLALKYKNGEIIEMDAGGIMVRQTGLSENYRISGTFQGSTSFGGIASSSTYTFSKNASVSVTKAGYVNAGVTTGRAENSKTGTYTIKGSTLFINYTDGTKDTLTIGSFGANKLVIGSNWLTAQ